MLQKLTDCQSQIFLLSSEFKSELSEEVDGGHGAEDAV